MFVDTVPGKKLTFAYLIPIYKRNNDFSRKIFLDKDIFRHFPGEAPNLGPDPDVFFP